MIDMLNDPLILDNKAISKVTGSQVDLVSHNQHHHNIHHAESMPVIDVLSIYQCFLDRKWEKN